jgi:hypothetical protein
LDLVNSRTKQAAVASQPRPKPYSNIYMFFLTHIIKRMEQEEIHLSTKY